MVSWCGFSLQSMGWMLLSDSVSLLLLLSLSLSLSCAFFPSQSQWLYIWLAITYYYYCYCYCYYYYWLLAKYVLYIYTYIYACSYYFIPSKSAPKKRSPRNAHTSKFHPFQQDRGNLKPYFCWYSNRAWHRVCTVDEGGTAICFHRAATAKATSDSRPSRAFNCFWRVCTCNRQQESEMNPSNWKTGKSMRGKYMPRHAKRILFKYITWVT